MIANQTDRCELASSHLAACFTTSYLQSMVHIVILRCGPFLLAGAGLLPAPAVGEGIVGGGGGSRQPPASCL